MSVMEIYLRDLRSSNPLEKDEELSLALKARAGCIESRNKLVTSNLRYALSVAKKFANNKLPLEDLISAANVGLISAADKYDASYGVKFITYARTWIQEAIMRELNNRYLVYTPSSKDVIYTTSIDQPVPGTEDLYLYETLSYQGARADADLNKQSFKDALYSILDSYPVRTREILDGYFNLYNEYTSIEDICKKYKLTGERVRGIKNNVLRDLKEEFQLEM